MMDDDGFIYEESEGITEEEELLLSGLKRGDAIDPVTGRRKKKVNPLNAKKMNARELEEFFLGN